MSFQLTTDNPQQTTRVTRPKSDRYHVRPKHLNPLKLIEDAIANGTHGPTQTVCDGCGNWVDCIYYVVQSTPKRRLCAACADGIGQGPASLPNADLRLPNEEVAR